jgi:hypothetical protein
MQNLKNDFINEVKIYSLDCLIRHYERKTNGHFFSKDTLKFWASRINDNLYYDYSKKVIYFITSEKCGPLSDERKYTLRQYEPSNGRIDYAENTDFLGFDNLRQAKNFVLNILKRI